MEPHLTSHLLEEELVEGDEEDEGEEEYGATQAERAALAVGAVPSSIGGGAEGDIGGGAGGSNGTAAWVCPDPSSGPGPGPDPDPDTDANPSSDPDFDSDPNLK